MTAALVETALVETAVVETALVEGVPGRDERIATLRRRLAAVPAKGVAPERDRRVLDVPEPLARLLPGGGLARGTVVTVVSATPASGATSLLLGLLAAVTAAGDWAAVIGRPGLGLLAATEMGADLARLALVPDPGPDAVDVAAVLLDGVDLVVLDLAGATVVPSRARGLAARARHRGGVLVVTGGNWPGAELELRSTIETPELRTGRVCERELAVRVGGRGRAGLGGHARMVLEPGRDQVRWVGTHGEAERLAQ